MIILRAVLTLTLIVSFASYTLQDDFAAQHAAALTACVEESGVTKEQVAEISAQEILDGDNKIKCYQKCMFTKFGVMDDSGEIIDDDGLQAYGAHFLNSTENALTTKACKDAEGPDPADLCAVAASLVKCMAQTLGQPTK